jgi:hypothetical protein
MVERVAIAALAAIFAAGAYAQSNTATPDVSGTWLNNADAASKLVLTEKDGKLRIQELSSDKPVADYTCAMDGKECTVKESGHSEKVMIYYNGPKVVEIKERGEETVKRRFAVGSDGKTLEVEIIPLSGPQKPEKQTFQREPALNAKSTS